MIFILYFSADTFKVRTLGRIPSTLYNVWIPATHRQHIVLGVKGCQDATLFLPQWWRDPDFIINSYRVILGFNNNARSYIYDHTNVIKVNMSTPSILSCNEVRYFWVQWRNYLIEVGRGHIVNENRFMAWQDNTPTRHDVQAVSLSTAEATYVDWFYSQFIGKLYTLTSL